MFKANNKNNQTTSMKSFSTYVTPCSSISIAEFEQINVIWLITRFKQN